jgi:uroporphyrinogen decarboxylase
VAQTVAPPGAPFLLACRRQPAPYTPVWFMRQAGRSLPEFRAVREKHSFFDVIRSPELTAEVTLQPVRRLGVDAAILFSDIVTPLAAIGVEVEMRSGVGPVFAEPFRGEGDLDRLRPLEPDADLAPVIGAVRILVGELDVPLIGFAGAPFTLASYLVEGGPSRDYERTKALMLGRPDVWRRLMERLADLVLASLRAQVAAGASAVQLFDSWAGVLRPRHYVEHVLPASRRVLDGLADLGVPRIHFGVTTGELLGAMAAGADVVGIDWRVPLDQGWTRVGDRAVQGNLDPAVLGAPWEVVAAEADDVLAAAAGRPGHVFNLGHGVLPDTDPDVLARLVDHVHARTAQ